MHVDVVPRAVELPLHRKRDRTQTIQYNYLIPLELMAKQTVTANHRLTPLVIELISSCYRPVGGSALEHNECLCGPTHASPIKMRDDILKMLKCSSIDVVILLDALITLSYLIR